MVSELQSASLDSQSELAEEEGTEPNKVKIRRTRTRGPRRGQSKSESAVEDHPTVREPSSTKSTGISGGSDQTLV